MRFFPVSVVLALATAFGSPSLAPAQGRIDAGGYQELLNEVRGGLFISSGRVLAGFDPDSVERVVRDFIASAPGARELKMAALLHTEAMAHGYPETHVELARNLLKAIPDPDDRDDWIRRWWLALAFSYQVQLSVGPGVVAFEGALEDMPGDRDVRRAFAAALWMFGKQREEPTYLTRAGVMLQQLLEETPDDPDLRIRFAGVLLDLGRSEDAIFVLDQLGDARLRSGPRLAQLLIRGEIALGAGEFAAAEAAFAEAVRRSRRSPAAVAGLVAARLSQGDGEGAAEAAGALLARPQTSWEPEWRYWLGPALDYPGMFEAMKNEVREPAEEGSER
ncbi:MAG: tetratricopeptide repeat protein [Acidobacteria bacterium]|nr:tetratricopeptide repeat protein [Acidobacteriota bacterium]MYA46379.1 tetratricopeptide repeat protein [Acidobacteriota bacterium]MYB33446.1 tetratricopeptide repeat protein [Acidobacteriota bacterium]MYH22365.1 tetratricopeptide repeat protein [Acidobacteriota bacterium]MYI38143.1 tetratricopeptide repeat protein [Acidobacteriota bacterium]